MPHSAFDRARSGINALRIKLPAFKIASSRSSLNLYSNDIALL